jgi:Transposase
VIEHVARVAVVNPSQFKVISQSVKKTDKNDAELPALYLAKGLLPEVRMKERKQREMSHLAQTRDLLVKQRSALKAKINNLLSAEGINLKREALSSNKALERVLAVPLSPLMGAETRVLVGQIRGLNRVGGTDRRGRTETCRSRKPDEHQGHRLGQRRRAAERDRRYPRLLRRGQAGRLPRLSAQRTEL